MGKIKKKLLSELDLTPEKENDLLDRIAIVEQMMDPQLVDEDKKKIARQYMDKIDCGSRTLKNYIKRYAEHGASGLVLYERKHVKGSRNSKELVDAAIALIKENPRRSIPKIREILIQDDAFHDEARRVSERQFYRIAARNGLDSRGRSLIRDDRRLSYRSFEAPHSMALVQGDARDGIWIDCPDGKKRKTYLFAWIDDYSRKILYAQYYWDEKLPRMEDSFRKMALRYGLPEKIYLDNGSVYISHHFRIVMCDLKVAKLHHPSYLAYCKGKVEATMKKIKNDFQNEAQHAGIRTLEELNSAFLAWCALKYDLQALSTTGEAPGERFVKGLTVQPRRVENLDEFMQYFLFRETRTVTKYGRIKLAGNSYPVKKFSYGSVVHIRYDPFDLSKAFVYDDNGVLIETTQPITVVNTRDPNMPEEKAHSTETIQASSQKYFENLRRLHMEAQRKAMPNLEYEKLSKKEDKDE